MKILKLKDPKWTYHKHKKAKGQFNYNYVFVDFLGGGCLENPTKNWKLYTRFFFFFFENQVSEFY